MNVINRHRRDENLFSRTGDWTTGCLLTRLAAHCGCMGLTDAFQARKGIASSLIDRAATGRSKPVVERQ